MPHMVGVAVALVMALLAGNAALTLLKKPLERLDPAERLGVAGLLGLGGTSLALFLLGLLPGGLGFGPWAVGILLLVFQRAPQIPPVRRPEGWGLASLALTGLLGLQALIGVLAPSTSLDWDSLAYHMAVPMKWLAKGQIVYIPALHQSNFPSAANVLYIPGLALAGESGAKAVQLMFFILGCLAVFGIARRWAGEKAGWIALVGFAGIPVAAWEAGTAYIDMAHGLYAALAVAYAFEALVQDEDWAARTILAAAAMSFCLSTKLTGLQVMFLLGVMLAAGGAAIRRPMQGIKTAFVVCLAGLALACPWFIRTAVNTGSPVYPFFNGIFQGREWDKWRADIYAEEQASFGVPKTPASLGHAVLGLAYQPGRYTNPRQDQGGGFPTGAIGFGVVFAVLAAAAGGRAGRKEKLILGYVGLGLLLWFVLSHQSRYLPILAVPGVIAAAAAAARTKDPLIPAAFGLQAAVTLSVIYLLITQAQLPVALGRTDPEAWRESMVPFARAAKELNRLPQGSKIVLYDEVFGFLVRHETMWGNPGHSTLIPHEASKTGAEWAEGLRKLGITHVYISTMYMTKKDRERWAQAARLSPGEPYTAEEKEGLWKDLRTKWRWLAADASRNGAIIPLTSVGSGVIFALSNK